MFCYFISESSYHGMLMTEENSNYKTVVSSGSYTQLVLGKSIIWYTTQ
jgi:hypothetical protein